MILWRAHHTSTDSLELLQHWWKSTSSGIVFSFDWGESTPVPSGWWRQQSRVSLGTDWLCWRATSCHGSLPELHCRGWTRGWSDKWLMWSCCWDAQESPWTAQRSDCHTAMCSLHSSAPTPLNRQCKEPFKCQSSRAARTKCFLFLSLRSWQIKNRLSVLADWLYLPAGYVIPWQRTASALQ